jgi:hypothetical protein
MNETQRKGIILFYKYNPFLSGNGRPVVTITYEGEEPLPTAFADMLPLLKQKLEATVPFLVEECGLVENNFDGDDSYRFVKVEYKDFCYVYSFKNLASYTVEVRFGIETVKVV